MWACGEEGFGNDDGRGTAVGGGTALEFCEWVVDGRGGEDLIESVGVAELRVGVFGRVCVIDTGDLSKVGSCGTVSEAGQVFMLAFGMGPDSLLHVFPACITKHLRRTRCICPPFRDLHHFPRGTDRIAPVLEESGKRSGKHLLESNDHDTVRCSMADHRPRHMQARRARAAIVVDIVDGDLCHAKLIENALAAGGVAVTVTGDSLIDIIVVDLGIEKGFDTGFEAQFGIIDCNGDECVQR